MAGSSKKAIYATLFVNLGIAIPAAKTFPIVVTGTEHQSQLY